MLWHIDSRFRSAGSKSITNFEVSVASLTSSHARGQGRIRFRNMQLAYTMYNIRADVNSKFAITYSDFQTKTLIIPVGNPTIAQVVSALKLQADVNTSGTVTTWVVDNITAKLSINTSQPITLSFTIDPEAGQVLGFDDQSLFTSLLGNVTSPYPVNVTPIKYVYLQATGLGLVSNDFDSKTKQTTSVIAKIPLNGNVFANISYDDPAPEWRHTNKVSDNIAFKLTDKDGNEINLNGHNFSFTLEYTSDINFKAN